MPLLHTQRLLGHSDPVLTAKICTHLETEDLRASIELVAAPASSELPADACRDGSMLKRQCNQEATA